MAKRRKKGRCKPPKGSPRFVTHFRHWRSGKILSAADYGHKAWPLG